MAAVALDYGTVMIVIVVLTIPIAAIAFASSGPALKTLGKGRFAIDRELPQQGLAPPAPISPRQREAEVRQMLEAKSYRRQARGESPLDIEAELARLMAKEKPGGGDIDAELRAEVRSLVIARNERRMRRGQPPLDIEAEIERQLSDLENLGQ
jgi:hypothetical protein